MPPDHHRTTRSQNSRLLLLILSVVLILLVCATAWRTYKKYSPPSRDFDWGATGMSDFHNGTYFPTQAFWQGINPYAASVRDHFPMARQSPIYSPVVFILHGPFAWLPLPAADVVFFAYNLALLLLAAWLAIRWTDSQANGDVSQRVLAFVAMSIFLLASRPGHISVFTGYFTIELVIGTWLALQYSSRNPALSGLGVLLSSGKPTYVIPLIILLLIQRRWRAVFWGLLFSFIAGMLGLAWLAQFEGWQQVLQGIREGQDGLHQDPNELPVNSWTRIDLLGAVAKLARWAPDDKIYLGAMLIQLAAIAPFLNRATRKMDAQGINAGVAGPAGWIALLAMTLSIYHHSYDAMLVAILIPSLVARTWNSHAWRWAYGFAILLITIPFFNYFSTRSVRDLMGWDPFSPYWIGLTLLNTFCLLVTLILILVCSTRDCPEPAGESSQV